MFQLRWSGILSICVLAVVSKSWAADPLAHCKVDVQEKVHEDDLPACLIGFFDPNLTKVDANKDGLVSTEEVAIFIEPTAIDLGVFFGHEAPYTLAELRRFFDVRQKARFGGVLVRRTHEDITLAAKPKDSRKVEGALFSYSRDAKTDEDSWLAKGAILRPVRLDDPAKGNADTAYQLIPSLTFERSGSDKESEDEANTLAGRLAVDLEWKNRGFDLQNLRLGFVYATDSDLASRVGALEVDWEPTELRLGMGVFRSGLPFRYRWSFGLHGEYGEVFAPGGKDLVDGEAFLRTGAYVSLELQPKESDRITFSGTYRHLWGLEGELDTVELTTGGISVRLDDDGRFSFEFEYKNGRLPLTLEDVETFTTGFGIKN